MLSLRLGVSVKMGNNGHSFLNFNVGVREEEHEVVELFSASPESSTPSLRRGAAVKIGKSWQGPWSQNKKKCVQAGAPQKWAPGQESR